MIIGVWKKGFFIKEIGNEMKGEDKENSAQNIISNEANGRKRSILNKGSEVSLTNSIAVGDMDKENYGFYVSN